MSRTTFLFSFVAGVLGAGLACGGSSASAGPDLDAGDDAETSAKPSHPDKPVEAVDPPAARWCTTQAPSLFCADFDGRDPLEGWDGVEDTPTGFVDVASDRSPPHAVRFTERATSFDAGESPIGPAFVKDIAVSSPSRAVIGFDLRVESAGVTHAGQQGIVPVTFALAQRSGNTTSFKLSGQLDLAGPADTVIGVLLDPARDDGGTQAKLTSIEIPPLPPKKWIHVEIAFQRGPDGWGVTGSYDGTVVGSWASGEQDLGPLNDVHIEIGSAYPSFHDEDFVADFDDVRVTTQ